LNDIDFRFFARAAAPALGVEQRPHAEHEHEDREISRRRHES
jgi:hypothetical protein